MINFFPTYTFLYNPRDNHFEGTISQSLPHLLSDLWNHYNETQQPVEFSRTYKPFPKTKILCNSRMLLWHIQPDSNASLIAKSYYLTVYNDMEVSLIHFGFAVELYKIQCISYSFQKNTDYNLKLVQIRRWETLHIISCILILQIHGFRIGQL